MLIQFSVQNFKSIRNKITLDMRATDIKENKEEIIKANNGKKYLPLAALYGPNGGGKSNVIEALFVLISRIVAPIMVTKGGVNFNRLNEMPSVVPFAFSQQTQNEPTVFTIYFRTELAEYRYELHFNKDKISYEKLDYVLHNSDKIVELFRRIDGKIQLKNKLSNLNVSANLSVSMPLLAYLGFSYDKNDIVNDVVTWFVNKIDIINYGNPRQEMQMAIASTEKEKTTILNMMRKLHLDIEDYRTEEDANGQVKFVYTTHVVSGYKAELELHEESRGTRKIFGMLPFIVRSLSEGRVLVIDELDAKLHPLLLKYIIKLFSNMNINTHNAQLVFTSHDLSTMNSSVFRRDEIWFVAKGNCQDSSLYSLVEFKEFEDKRKKKNGTYDVQYLQGKYGADPYLQKILKWSDIDG